MTTVMNLKENYYFPFQPEIKINTNAYIELKPVYSSISKDIALFYQFKTNKELPISLSLIPDGCFDILFCCNSRNPSAFLWTSPLQRRQQQNFENDCEYFGVRFFPEQAVIKLNYSMRKLLDKQIPLFNVMSADSSIEEVIAAGKSFGERIKRFEKFLNRANFTISDDQKIVNYAIQKIYSSNGTSNINHLANQLGYSEQYIRRKFEEYIGFSPKQFCQIVKFQNSLNRFLETGSEIGSSDLLDIVHENGYYDQAHFIRGFKKMMNLTPKQYKKTLVRI
ncbi:helix-turn-helix domain-containing protein [Metabacillus rhizolycopersici]|uniref:Helix-turn-helix domain-containing protein n=1 Tax=Metabacillus rhizolycopersici TaxID=2875709 RepID=A0ABS7UX64_9BACI|nr:helix-turn-helix domain-containing protein [Metabacillus rhizolycopersici]MBZ5752916.1 helix-turn-helix domain-containing protein [Metabacillus rhizolycopersici]